MKKVIGLCLVVLLSSTSVFARENRRMDKRKMDPSARCEKMIADLKLDEKQAVTCYTKPRRRGIPSPNSNWVLPMSMVVV